jgi:hypothetical protein
MRTIEASEVYSHALKDLSDRTDIEDAVSALLWALKNNAEDFPVIPGYKTLRMAKTDSVRDVPSLHLIFKILGDKVRLEYIETAESDEFRGPPIL